MTTSPHSDSDRASSAFGRLHERVREWVYRQGWTEFRDIQETAVGAILAAERDVVIASATASGKTEAAFLPIVSGLVGSPLRSVEALYVGPLKALINDQFRRLDLLCEDLEIPVHRWHGDVGASEKRRVVRMPSGILLITPESLEAQFVLRGGHIPRIFAGLRHVVVDELHAYLGTERGRQLQSQLHRIETALGRRIQRIGLSATLGDVALAADGLRPGHGAEALTIESASGEQELHLQVRGYRESAPVVVSRGDRSAPRDRPTPTVIVAEEGLAEICADIFRTLRGSKNVVFANARTQVEAIVDQLTRLCEEHGVPLEFFAHHGSLAKDLREFIEERLKSDGRPTTVVCTSTLELGMDIGTVASVALVGPPHSVASLRQRLGRSGRRGEPAVLRVYCAEREIIERSPLPDRLRQQLVQTVAMIDLLLSGWCEPPIAAALHFSTLVQQILSFLCERGGASALETWEVLCRDGPFGGVTRALFADQLRDLGEHDLVTQLGDGTLVLGVGGETLTGHYDFYSAFETSIEWTLTTAGHVLGSIPIEQPLFEGQRIVFGGRRWRVDTVNPRSRDVFVVPAKGGKPPRFGGEGGLVHDRVRERMRAVLVSTEMPAYLDARARDLLAEAREQFARTGLTEHSLVRDGRDTAWLPWVGDRVMNTLEVELRALGLTAMRDGIALTVAGVTPNELSGLLQGIATRGPSDPHVLASHVANKFLAKHDRFLRPALLELDYAAKRLDTVGAHRAACHVLSRR